MAALHRRFMGLTGPTDVLTFPLDTDARGRVTGGEVVVCVPEARRNSRRSGVPLRHELLLYALHGMLHLIGLDDRTEPAYRKIHRTEDRILMRLGIGSVFRQGQSRPLAEPTSARRGRLRMRDRSAATNRPVQPCSPN